MKYTLTLYTTETRTSQRTIEIEAADLYQAQTKLLNLPDEQFVEESKGVLSATGMAFHTSCNKSEWAYGDWDLLGDWQRGGSSKSWG